MLNQCFIIMLNQCFIIMLHQCFIIMLNKCFISTRLYGNFCHEINHNVIFSYNITSVWSTLNINILLVLALEIISCTFSSTSCGRVFLTCSCMRKKAKEGSLAITWRVSENLSLAENNRKLCVIKTLSKYNRKTGNHM